MECIWQYMDDINLPYDVGCHMMRKKHVLKWTRFLLFFIIYMCISYYFFIFYCFLLFICVYCIFYFFIMYLVYNTDNVVPHLTFSFAEYMFSYKCCSDTINI
jgi:hypothetical protein